jgi:hypothetical protein
MQNSSENNYLSQAEASALAGVSGATLLRFAEAGYFRTYEQNGQTQFSRHEIFQVFGPAIPASASSKSSGNSKIESPQSESVKSQSSESFEASESLIAGNQMPSSFEAPPIFQNNSPLSRQIEKIIEPSTNLNSEDSYNTSDTTAVGTIKVDNTEKTRDSEASNQNNEAFKKVLQLQEDLLSQRESRIAELLKERDWLRSRLEKMEDKSDRDQMLLMVESQKVRTLIDKASPKPGIIRLALDWLGNSNSTQAGSESNSENKN